MSWRAEAPAAFLLMDLWLIYQPLSLLHSRLGFFARKAVLPAGNAVDNLRFHFWSRFALKFALLVNL